MLGWEFPPHISGGLGTACLGLSQGLAQCGVEVTFVVPRLTGDETPDGVQLVAATDVPVPVSEPTPGFEPWSGAAGQGAPDPKVPVRLRHAYSGSRSKKPLEPAERLEQDVARGMQMLAVNSPLRPYMTEADYARQLEELARRKDAPSGPPTEAGSSSAGPAAGSGPSGREHLPFEGGYGPDLFTEVERYARVVREIARREDFDVVHAHDWMTYPAGIAAALVGRKPLVAHVHASEYDRSGKNPEPNIRAIESEGFRRADLVVCVSQYTAGVLREHYGAEQYKLRVLHNAVTSSEQREHLRWEKATDDPVVLFLGRITYQKGPDYFLEAARKVLDVLPNVRFVLSGSGDMWPRMVERAASLGIAENTHFTGFLEGEEVERMFAMADIYVMPSVSEPFGISPLEAMALDVPVIVSRQSGVAEVLSNALKVDFWDVEDLANKIIALLSYPELRDELMAEGRTEVERMSWKDRGRTLRGIYEELTA